MLTQHRSRRSPSGSRYKKARGKRLHETGSEPTFTRVGERFLKAVRLKGGALKAKLLRADTVNLLDPKTKTYKAVKIRTVADNPASKHFIRRNIITKGTVLDTEAGKARVTNRPGQEGAVNAVLIQ
ncbi:30S ribosomal protein S8e [Candidatus Woesearchaeota archaeon]|nr:30S ribosomal protein S8e [Candidatus Woesearchaeota archaeon]